MILLCLCCFRKTIRFSNQRAVRPVSGWIQTVAGLAAIVNLLAGCSFSATGQSTPLPLPRAKAPDPIFEVFPKESDGAAERFFPLSSFAASPHRPRVAIIIDDIGYDLSMVRALLSLNAPLTFSVLPNSPFAEASAREIHDHHREVMLHLPMEPVEYPRIDPGEDALLAAMSSDQLRGALEKSLDAVPFVQGVNNHMGSRLTRMPVPMFRILSAIYARRLYFVDSVTSPESICVSVARNLQIPFGRRDIFLDHIQTPERIRRQIKRLTDAAERYGEAVGIGHPHKVTFQVLKKTLPELQKRVDLVPASQVLHTIG